MAGFGRSTPASNALLFLAGAALFICGLLAGLVHTGSGPKNLRAPDQTLPQQQDKHSHGLLLPTVDQLPKNTNLASLRSLDKGDEEQDKPDAFVWPGNFAYETFHAMDQMDNLAGNLPDLSALDFTGSFSFSFSFDYDDDAWAA